MINGNHRVVRLIHKHNTHIIGGGITFAIYCGYVHSKILQRKRLVIIVNAPKVGSGSGRDRVFALTVNDKMLGKLCVSCGQTVIIVGKQGDRIIIGCCRCSIDRIR